MSEMTADARNGVESPDATKKYVYLFNEVDQAEAYCQGSWDGVRGLLGGKGANLSDMTRLDVPVPPGFTVTTEACLAYLANNNEFPESLWQQVLDAVKDVERQTGKEFGNPANPLLVSCRSGAKFSMPGMMDTVLDIGLNKDVALAWKDRSGDDRFVYDAYRRLVQMFGSVVLGVPDEVFEHVISDFRKRAGVETDAELNGTDLRAIMLKFKDIILTFTGKPFPDGSVRAAAAGDGSGLQVLERQTSDRLPQRRRH